MNARELRIGNYVTVGGLRATVTAIFTNATDDLKVRVSPTDVREIKIDDAKPIPLTMELLSKFCGFDTLGRYTLGVDSHRYYLRLEEGFIILLNRQSEAIIHFWDVKSLHQLQNLYYALKGEDMKIDF